MKVSPTLFGLAFAALLATSTPAHAADPAANDKPTAQFLFLGSYHMGNPGRDVFNTKADDVLDAKRQREIEQVAELIRRYHPTKILVEEDPADQAKLDEHFAASCKGTRPLTRNEVEQLGFRIACKEKLPGVIAMDWNDLGPIKDEDSVDYLKAIDRNHQQAQRAEDMRIGTAVHAEDQRTLDKGTVRDMLARLNSQEWLTANAHSYFRISQYGSPTDAAGVNWLMLWSGRNLMMFNNIVRNTEPGDRVLVICGAGHGNLMRQLATDSGVYEVQDTERWLREGGR